MPKKGGRGLKNEVIGQVADVDLVKRTIKIRFNKGVEVADTLGIDGWPQTISLAGVVLRKKGKVFREVSRVKPAQEATFHIQDLTSNPIEVGAKVFLAEPPAVGRILQAISKERSDA